MPQNFAFSDKFYFFEQNFYFLLNADFTYNVAVSEVKPSLKSIY